MKGFRFEIRISARERAEWVRWAELDGFRTVSEWLRHLANAAGKKAERAEKKSTDLP